jgi:hypothetical protein
MIGRSQFAPTLGTTVRAAFVVVGLGAIAWASNVLPVFWSERNLHAIARHIVAGERYSPDVMAQIDARIADGAFIAQPSALEDVAIIRQREAETALNGGGQGADAAVAALGVAIDRALAAVPTSSFLWLMRFWALNHADGFYPENLANLEESYATGPYEGWIAIERCRLAVAVFPDLPNELSDAAVADFVGLVRSGLFSQAADILAGPGVPFKAVLLEALKPVSLSTRLRFSQTLIGRDLGDFIVPGIETKSDRPWQH